MNYYIKGDAAKADKIKAAFEDKGYDATGWKFNVEGVFYYTHDGIIDLACGKFLINLIKTHPDYKELELPVEPKFKVGDKISWINHDCDTQTITDIRDGSYITVDKHGVRCALKFVNQDKWELVPKPHYDISNFYAGMPVLVRIDEGSEWHYVLFSHTRKMPSFRFVAGAATWNQCIPFEGNEHLLGTTDPCDEQYINW